MGVRNNKLLMFNSINLLKKREVLESFNEFVAHHRQIDNEEGYSEGKRKTLLSLCDEFRRQLEISDIPALTKPWLFYDYTITNDSIELSLWKCHEVEFDDEDEISSISASEEYTLVEVKCDYLTVEEYAAVYGVTTTTVRQWIRRGKLRTAMKKGRDWLIPALADKPKRGFESAIFKWKILNNDIIKAFPFLSETNRVYLIQDNGNRNLFHAITGQPGSNDRQKATFTRKEREQFEITLIADPGVEVEDLYAGVNYIPTKTNLSLPILSYRNYKTRSKKGASADESDNANTGEGASADESDNANTDEGASTDETGRSNKDVGAESITGTGVELDGNGGSAFKFENIVVKQHINDVTHFSPDAMPGYSSNYDYASTYLVGVNWDFWGVKHGRADILRNALDIGDYSGCEKIGMLSGCLVLCEQMISDGYDPLAVCGGESIDLKCMMAALTNDGGPLNGSTGEPMLDVLYIDELVIEEPLRRQGLGRRILLEIPPLCRELLHVFPDILAYYPAPIICNWQNETEKRFAMRNLAGKHAAKVSSVREAFKNNQSSLISLNDKYSYKYEFRIGDDGANIYNNNDFVGANNDCAGANNDCAGDDNDCADDNNGCAGANNDCADDNNAYADAIKFNVSYNGDNNYSNYGVSYNGDSSYDASYIGDSNNKNKYNNYNNDYNNYNNGNDYNNFNNSNDYNNYNNSNNYNNYNNSNDHNNYNNGNDHNNYDNSNDYKGIMGYRHCDSYYPEEMKNSRIIAFYRNTGFQELGDSRILYAYTEMWGG